MMRYYHKEYLRKEKRKLRKRTQYECRIVYNSMVSPEDHRNYQRFGDAINYARLITEKNTMRCRVDVYEVVGAQATRLAMFFQR